MRVQLAEVALEVQVSGEGPTVLLLHGFPDSHTLWRHQVAALNAAGYRTIAPDLRGFGASDKPEGIAEHHPGKHVGDLFQLLGHLGVDRFHLVGHDWGSGIAQGLAGAARERVLSLSILSVGHMAALEEAGWEQRKLSWYMLLFQHVGLAEDWLSRNDFAHLREMLAEHPDAAEITERLREPGALTSALSVYRAGVPAEALFGDVPPLPPLPGPVLGLWGTDDRFLTEQSMSGTGKHVEGAWRYERVADAGHWLPLDQPERVNALLLDFMAGVGAE
ncbi:alpha/beta fold hydrolase [Streptomyces sp. NPDC050504]|uniref:alpha/beta fold hydrolase n=1 Tax=Streptomyces sp. NPDC050504 TaxID=3365618 RepID=UPI0037BA89CD